jgi:hypothetical protein
VKRAVLSLGAVLVLAGCASLPTGPSVMVLPGTGKPFEQFQNDDAVCRQFASQSVGGEPGNRATQSTVSGAAIGTALGAAAGAVLGAAAGSPGTGAAIGAGTGLIGGTAVGASAGYSGAGEAQRRYDVAYQQCMYAKGNQIPGAAPRRARYAPPPPPPPPAAAPPAPAAPPASQSVPPPPAGTPPPPPPDAR